jgi:hypothetical protein
VDQALDDKGDGRIRQAETVFAAVKVPSRLTQGGAETVFDSVNFRSTLTGAGGSEERRFDPSARNAL